MVVAGVLLILAVLLDAWRRVRRDRLARIKVKLVDPDTLPPEIPDERRSYGELPNGGARVVDRGDILKAAGFPSSGKAGNVAGSASGSTSGSTSGSRVEKSRAKKAVKPQADHDHNNDDDDLLPSMSSIAPDDEVQNLDWLDGLVAEDEASRKTSPPPPGKLPRGVEPEVFMLNVVSRKKEGFRGDDILQILLACDLRFGDMDFFHRHEFEAGRGAIQFSVADMMQPGVFDIDNMADMTTPGLVFFLTLPGPEDMMQAYDYMLETAQAVARNLKGDVLDESRSVLTRQSMEHNRQQIRELERRLLANAR
jgi:cell division protein ZipA